MLDHPLILTVTARERAPYRDPDTDELIDPELTAVAAAVQLHDGRSYTMTIDSSTRALASMPELRYAVLRDVCAQLVHFMQEEGVPL